MEKNYIIGYDKDFIDACENDDISIDGYYAKEKNNSSMRFMGTDECLSRESRGRFYILLDDPKKRELLSNILDSKIKSYISKLAYVSKKAVVKNGTIIMPYVYVSADCVIGSNVKINVRTNIHHDCYIGANSVISPSVTLLGNVRVGELCNVGAQSVIRNRIEIANEVIIGANSFVNRNIVMPGLYMGVISKRKDES